MKKIVNGKKLIDFSKSLWEENYHDYDIDPDTVIDLMFNGNIGHYNESDENKLEVFQSDFQEVEVTIIKPNTFELEYDEDEWDPEDY